jgi:hypothetical protein
MEDGIYDAARKDTFDAQSILAAVSDNVPAALTVAEQRLIGRITGGDIAALTAAQIRTLISVVSLPGTIAAVLSDHNKAAHDALLIDAGSVDSKEPGTIAGKLPYLDGSAFLTLSQVVGNVPSLDGTGKLILTGSSQIGTKTADLAELWTKGTLIDDSMIGLNEIHAEGTSNFAGSGGVTVTHNLNLSNYTPTIVPTADAAGALGEVWFTDIAINSFVVRNSGIAVTAFTWSIHNRT